MTNFAWQLPKGFDELLPSQARELERLRQALLQVCYSWGYDYIVPPFAEFMDVLSVGTGQDILSEIFQVADNHSDNMLGVRADMTPQVARIDANKLADRYPSGINRLCYLGTVLRARGEENSLGSRSPFQYGAELYGHSGVEADIEVLQLLVESLQKVNVPAKLIDFGHVGIFHELTAALALNKTQTRKLYHILQSKSVTDLNDWIRSTHVESPYSDVLRHLIRCYGDFDEAMQRFKINILPLMPSLAAHLDTLEVIGHSIKAHYPTLHCQLDFAEFKGYRYHTGIVFAAYHSDAGREIARGGRYNHIGESFGRARSATGFSADLKLLMRINYTDDSDSESAIFAPHFSSTPMPASSLIAAIQALRDQGKRVVQALNQSDVAKDYGCTEKLCFDETQQEWRVNPL